MHSLVSRSPLHRMAQGCLTLGLVALTSSATAQSIAPARVLVEWQSAPALSAEGFSGERMRRATVSTQQTEMSALARELGARLRVSSGPANHWSVVSAEGLTEAELMQALAARPGVRSVSPDRRKHIARLPNDPRYGEQWAWSMAETAAIRAENAWDITTGDSAVVVAVIDTGVRFDHEDLRDRLLPGYDFVSSAEMGGDGDGRDADASDPGDFLTADELRRSFFSGCGEGDAGDRPVSSSWHGTAVAGIVAASGNNSRGMAGVSWSARILPVRALGKCGGYDSDILAAMRWSAGLPVPGVPNNPYPARIINLSLGGEAACSSSYREVINELRQRGVVVVAAAGNSGGVVDEPGNCPGVVTVGGLRHDGTKVGYSSQGPEVSVSAPGGNCGDGSSCRYQITTTTNLGRQGPEQNAYTDGTNSATGTSFSTPQASGVLALMLSVHPDLQADALDQRLRTSARSFPFVAGVPMCPDGDWQSGQCNCVVGQCGDGMLDAAGAVQAALRPQALITQSAGSTFVLDGTASTVARGRQLVSWEWRTTGGASVLSPHAARTELVANLSGEYPVWLTVRDNNGATDTLEYRVRVSGGGRPVNPVEPPQPTNSLTELHTLLSQLIQSWIRPR